MTRSRSTSRVGSMSLLQPGGCPRKGSRPLLLLLLLGLLSGSPVVWAQPAASPPKSGVAADSSAAGSTVTAQPASHWSTVWAVLGGVAIGALGVWFFVRKSPSTSVPAPPEAPVPAPIPVPEPVRKKPAENVRKSPPTEPPAIENTSKGESTGKGVSFQSMREVQGTTSKQPAKPSGKDKRNQPNFNSRNSPAANPSQSWPKIAPRTSAMNPTSPLPPPTGDNQPLEPGQTVEWAAPTSTPPAIQELIDSSAHEAAAAEAAPPAASNGPLHYYAPAPDVPSIEHRKLSPNPLPQMPLLITLPSAEAVTAQFSFSPQADQSRIIGNGVRELKEFFQFELPPTEQFTTIKNLKAGKLEKRDDAWHVVQKAEIALS
ncbi:hypothetical protein [Hymenobacter negativus]|uniref:Uncharacterized protein n=1 Tax=Hymenobacter negativus TaxID=2795026 RepID=A0ABS0Q5Z1_9BACT|nr:hypothetical protein [Hymenobacter negativus]MBH8558080.1 hypothetical protein [Hymenobacter negativus]